MGADPMNIIFVEGQPPVTNDMTAVEVSRGDYPLGSFLLFGDLKSWYRWDTFNTGATWRSVERHEVPAEYRAWSLIL